MGISQSSDIKNSSGPRSGYHVLQVQPNSPGSNAGLTPYFDFIVAAADQSFQQEDTRLIELLKSHLGRELKLYVYSTRTEKVRETTIVPSTDWGGTGLAGLSIRFCSFDFATEHVWHILEVYENTPASEAGLIAREDYIVGTPDIVFTQAEDFFSLVSDPSTLGKPIKFYVYNLMADNIRLISITPREWCGHGSLGCDIGYGYLHRIPTNAIHLTETQSKPPISSPGIPKPNEISKNSSPLQKVSPVTSPIPDQHLPQQNDAQIQNNNNTYTPSLKVEPNTSIGKENRPQQSPKPENSGLQTPQDFNFLLNPNTLTPEQLQSPEIQQQIISHLQRQAEQQSQSSPEPSPVKLHNPIQIQENL